MLVSLLGHLQLVMPSQQKWELLIQVVSKVPNLPWPSVKAAKLNRNPHIETGRSLTRQHPVPA